MTAGAAGTLARVRPVDDPRVDGAVDDAFRSIVPLFGRIVGGGDGGGALVVRRRGETVVDLCAGWTDRRAGRRWRADTLAISFSTTKGVASAVIHRLAQAGRLDYDEPVAAHWPEFGRGGKDRLTVRELLTHRAGLYSVQALARRAPELLDHLAMEERLAARTVRAPTRRSAYHAITYGWLLAGLARRVTGKGMAQLVAEEVAAPLGIEDLHIGAPAHVRARVARPVGGALRHLGSAARVLAPLWTRATAVRAAIEALHVDGFDRLFIGDEPPIWETEMPAVNGVFSGDALARFYGALANGGRDDGHTLLAPETVGALGRVQVRESDAVLGLRMRWRLGYHQAFGPAGAPRAFGHYGYGGSGGWADPDLGLSVGFVTNRIGSVSTPLGDLNLLRLGRAVHACARRAA